MAWIASDINNSEAALSGVFDGARHSMKIPGALSKLDRLISRWHLERFLKYRIAFGIILLFQIALVAVRFYHLSVTGFLVSDEAWYYESIVLGKPAQAGDWRTVFVLFYRLFFGGAKSLPAFFAAGAAFVLTWAIGTLCGFYLIIRELGTPEKYGSLMILSLPLIPVYVVMLPLMLTETMGLFFALLGILFTLRYVHSKNAWNALLSSIFFVMAYKVREPYLLLAVGNLLTIIATNPRGWKGALAYLLPLLTVLPIPVSLQPLVFAQPGFTYLIILSQWAWSHASTIVSTTVSNTVSTTVSNTALPITLPQVSPEVLAQPTFSLPNPTFAVLQAFAIGLTLGYNPLFAVFAAISVALGLRALLRRKVKKVWATDASALWNTVLSLAAFAISLFVLIYPAAGLLPFWTSTAIRTSHVSLPTILSFRTLYRRVKPKKLVAIILLFLVVASTQIPLLATALQTNLARGTETINRISFDYRAPYFRLYQIAEHSGKTLVVIGSNLRGALMYLSLLPNVTLSGIPGDESGFKSLVEGHWDTIILYDSFSTIQNPASVSFYPDYYKQVLFGTSYDGFRVVPIWIDGESYALRMVPNG